MIFSSLMFLFRFLPVFLLIYFVTPRRARNLVLFLGSLVFYAWGEPVYVGLMLFSTVSDYFHGIFIERAWQNGRERRAKALLVSSLVINLLMLGFFKYADFFIGVVNQGLKTAIPLLNLPLPVGISFYTFQTMSYTIDVYRKKVPAQKNVITFGAFVTMFPQLIAGPIVQYKSVERELEDRRVTAEGLTEGLRRFLLGLGKKVLLANQAGALYEQINGWSAENLTVLAAWTGILCFAFQIYFDFSGYSDMAVGLGKMMGFTFPENFNYPYLAKSVTDFWRRWHMSLSGWFREYVYIPLGGNRRGIRRQIFNILVVWMLTGIWHGASWNFLFWGLWFGFFLILEKLWLKKILEKLPRVFGIIYTWLVVLGGWVLFSCTTAESMVLWGKAMAGAGGAGLFNKAILYELSSNASLLVLLALGSTPLPARLGRRIVSRRDVGKDRCEGQSRQVRQTEQCAEGAAEIKSAEIKFAETKSAETKSVKAKSVEKKSVGTKSVETRHAETEPSSGWFGAIAETVWLLAVFLLSVAFLVDASYNPFLYFRF